MSEAGARSSSKGVRPASPATLIILIIALVIVVALLIVVWVFLQRCIQEQRANICPRTTIPP